MSKQMKWGLATLILLLGIAAVFLLMDKDTNTEPKMTLGQQTKDLLEQGVKLPQQANTSSAEKRQPPPGASPDMVKQSAPASQNVLPRTTENPKRRKWLREGEVKPGYFHTVDEEGYLVCDENGKLIQIPYGAPAFEIFTVIGFRPTYEEYQEYKKLGEQEREAYRVGNLAEYERLGVEILRFRREHQAELPDLTAMTVFPDDHTPRTPEASARFERLTTEKKDQLYREWGLGYLRED